MTQLIIDETNNGRMVSDADYSINVARGRFPAETSVCVVSLDVRVSELAYLLNTLNII